MPIVFLGSCRHLNCCKDIVLRRSTSGSLGFSIVGGREEVNCNQSFFIRSIVEGTPAYNDGRIRYLALFLLLFFFQGLHGKFQKSNLKNCNLKKVTRSHCSLLAVAIYPRWLEFFILEQRTDLHLLLHRCGDILLEVNGQSTWGMTHTALVRFLKELRGRITLTIVSWPGSLL